MNTPSLSNSSNNPHLSSRRRIQTQAHLLLDRVQQHFPNHGFTTSQLCQQQHLRFEGTVNTETLLECIETEVEGMRGVLESCWDLSATSTTAPHVPAAALLHRGFNSRQVQQHRLQRLYSRRNLGPERLPRQLPGPQEGISATSAAVAATSPAGHELKAHAGVFDQHTYQVQVLLNLWHLYSSHVESERSSGSSSSRSRSKPRSESLPNPPRLMTPEEECALGSIIQQNRKLQQLMLEHPDIAAAAFGTPSSPSSSPAALSVPAAAQPAPAAAQATPTTAQSSPTATLSGPPADAPQKKRGRPRKHPVSTDSSNKGSSSSSSSSNKGILRGPDRRYKWPPVLSDADIAEVTQLPQAWRLLLPQLAAQAQELLVSFNTRLVFYALHRSWRNPGVPNDDLITSGLAGLRLAASRFDPSKGTRFSTIATQWISQHIGRSSVSEAAKVIRRPHHHVLMVSYVHGRYGMDGVRDIANRPAVAQEVAQHFRTTPSAVIEAIQDTYKQSVAGSLEALASSKQSGKDNSLARWSELLTTLDLEEGDGQLAAPGHGPTIGGGQGTVLSAAGQMPSWAQTHVRSLSRAQPETATASSSGWHHNRQQHSSSSTSSSSDSGGGQAHQHHHHQQQQQQEDKQALAGAGSEQEHPGVLHQQVHQAATRLLQLAGSSSTPPATATGTMLDSLEDTEGELQEHMLDLLDILSPLERRVISLLYGLTDERTVGLGVELPPLAHGSISSDAKSSSSSSAQAKQRSSVGGSYAGSSQLRNPRTLRSARFDRLVMSLTEAATVLQLPSHQMVANIRNMALQKLATAARTAAAVASTGSTDAAAAAADKFKTAGYIAGTTITLIQLLQQYVAEYGCLPTDMQERYKGKRLACWLQRIRTRYRQGKVSPVVVAALEEAVPIWQWELPVMETIDSSSSSSPGRKRKRGKRGRRSSSSSCNGSVGKYDTPATSLPAAAGSAAVTGRARLAKLSGTRAA